MSVDLKFMSVGDIVEDGFSNNKSGMKFLCIKAFITNSNQILHFKPGSFYTFEKDEEDYVTTTETIKNFCVYKASSNQKEKFKDVLNDIFKSVTGDEMIKVRFIYPVNDLRKADEAIVKEFKEYGYEQELLKNIKLYQIFQAGTVLTEVFWELPVNRLSFLSHLLTPLYNTEDWEWCELDVDYADFESYGK